MRLACLLAADLPAEAQPAFLALADEFSPKVEEAGLGAAFLDLAPGRGESALCAALLRRCRERGWEARAAVADGRAAAYLAAESGKEWTIVQAGGDARFLAALPLERLDCSGELRRTLSQWGVKTAADLAALPAQQLADRLGPEAAALQRTARGEDLAPVLTRARRLEFREQASFEWSVCELEPFFAALGPAIQALSARMACAGYGARRLELFLALDPAGREERAVTLAAPDHQARVWEQLLRLELSERPPGAPVTGFRLCADAAVWRPRQLTLFGPPSQSPAEVSALLARLGALLGLSRVGSPLFANGHRPERFGLSPYQPPAWTGGGAAAGAPARPAARILRPAVALDARLGSGGAPAALRSRGQGPTIEGRVVHAAGPWRLEEGWWAAEAVRRDYWDVELLDGGVYRIFRDQADGSWKADGIYD